MNGLFRRPDAATVLALLLLGTAPATGRDVAGLFATALADTRPPVEIQYKSIGEKELHLHVFPPEPGVQPLRAAILWLHGGGWQAGEPSQLFPHCRYFSLIGYTNVAAEYRLAVDGGTVSDCVEDARDAFYWMHQNAAMLGVEPERIIVAGESAGGHLAACVGYLPEERVSGIPQPLPLPASCILVNPVTNLTTIGWALSKPGIDGDTELAASLSPLHHVQEGAPPAVLLHGDSDTVVAPQQSADLAAALHAFGRPAKLRLWQDKSHAFFLYLPQYNLTDTEAIHLSLLEIEAFLGAERFNGYPVVDGHFSPMHMFAGPDGYRSFSGLVAAAGVLYGTTYKGGPANEGTVFAFDPQTRQHTVLHAFSGLDGREVFNGLAILDGRIHGVCKFGGEHGNGTLFSVQTDGADFQVLHDFGATLETGFHPHSAPVVVDGVLYGNTYHGGSTTWGGVLYKFPMPDGPYEVIHSFTPETGRHPTGQLLPVGDWLYGTASDLFQSASGHYGTLFRFHRKDNTFELLHAFDGSSEGSHPYDALFFDGEDALIGTTLGEAFNPLSKGTVFSYSISNNTLTVLHDFGAYPSTGSKPNSAIIAAGWGSWLHGISHGSNAAGGDTGTLFRILPDGDGFTLLHRFTSGLSGNTPMRGLVRCGDALYGVTAFGGLTADKSNPESGGGMIFRYKPVIAPTEARTAYVAWLATNGLLINQPLTNDLENDGFSLIEEFALGGEPATVDTAQPIVLSLTPSGNLRADIPAIRTVMRPWVQPLTSVNLIDWQPEAGFAADSGNGEFESLSREWPDSTLPESPMFLRLKVGLEQ